MPMMIVVGPRFTIQPVVIMMAITIDITRIVIGVVMQNVITTNATGNTGRSTTGCISSIRIMMGIDGHIGHPAIEIMIDQDIVLNFITMAVDQTG
jgi:hypothetical protein